MNSNTFQLILRGAHCPAVILSLASFSCLKPILLMAFNSVIQEENLSDQHEERLSVLCENAGGIVLDLALEWYRAGGLLYPRLNLEGCGADVLKAKELWFWNGPELTHTSGFGRFFEQDLRTTHHLDVVDLHVSIEQLLLSKVLQPLWFNEGWSAASSAVTDGATFEIVAWLSGTQTQLISVGERKRKCGKKKQQPQEGITVIPSKWCLWLLFELFSGF